MAPLIFYSFIYSHVGSIMESKKTEKSEEEVNKKKHHLSMKLTYLCFIFTFFLVSILFDCCLRVENEESQLYRKPPLTLCKEDLWKKPSKTFEMTEKEDFYKEI